MEELLKHLTEVSIRQQQIVEHMAARQGEVEREVAALRTASAQRVEAIELAEAAQRREAGERMPIPRRVPQERRSPEGTFRPVGRPAAPVPQDEPMPTEPPTAPRRAWLAGCILHQEPPPAAPKVDVEVNGRPYRALLDSGSAVSLVQSTVVSPRPGSRAVLPITCVHGDTRQVPTRRVTISAAPGSWPIEVGLMKDLPVPVLLGRDWPGFDRLLALATQPPAPPGAAEPGGSADVPDNAPSCWPRTALETVSPPPSPLTFSLMCFSRLREAGLSPRNSSGTIG